MNAALFQQKIYSYFSEHRRVLPWRYEMDPYKVLVSEVMLQQTQVARVTTKYKEWLEKFPTVESLAEATLRDVLVVWQGLGYNRRGKYLKEAAETIVKDKRYSFLLCHSRESGNPVDFVDSGSRLRLSGMTGEEMIVLLQELPGIGQATAAAIVAYAFNKPVVFIETNIRAVYLYFYFKKDLHISDKQIADLVEKTLDYDNPRDWYYALTDYGNFLKTQEKFKNTQSKHYVRQSNFIGSRRQLRARLLFLISAEDHSLERLVYETGRDEEEVVSVLADLEKEAFIIREKNCYHLK